MKESKCRFCEVMKELIGLHEEDEHGEKEKEESDEGEKESNKAVKNNKKGW